MTKNLRKVRRERKKNHILENAKAVFSKKGYKSSSIGEIAEIAGVNKWNMYYYVGDKATLYASVIDELLFDVWKGFSIDLDAGQSGPELLNQLITGLASTANYRPLHEIVLGEMLSGGKHLPDKIALEIGRLISLCSNILKIGEEQGQFREVNPYIIFIMIFGALSYFRIIGPHIRKACVKGKHMKGLEPAVKEDVVESIKKIISDYILGARHNEPCTLKSEEYIKEYSKLK